LKLDRFYTEKLYIENKICRFCGSKFHFESENATVIFNGIKLKKQNKSPHKVLCLNQFVSKTKQYVGIHNTFLNPQNKESYIRNYFYIFSCKCKKTNIEVQVFPENYIYHKQNKQITYNKQKFLRKFVK
jgi:hypothetical protein